MPHPNRRRIRTGGFVVRVPDGLDEALRQVGDRWTLLLVDALLAGPRRFNELEEMHEGLAPNILSKRLKALEAEGIVATTPYSQRPLRVAYTLTAGGAELAGALRMLAQWGASRAPVQARPTHHVTCGTTVEARWWCPTCDRVVDDGEVPDLDFV
ncbi:MAG: helix-turn-helix transcriptional regulator [Actinomycetota bacterium]|nr:helix-turn-helix transcriptional regulator [Actinomycetota bacterium]